LLGFQRIDDVKSFVLIDILAIFDGQYGHATLTGGFDFQYQVCNEYSIATMALKRAVFELRHRTDGPTDGRRHPHLTLRHFGGEEVFE